MNKEQYLLLCLAEECNEVAHRVSKAIRFGLADVQRDQDLDNEQRLTSEIRDLIAVVDLLEKNGILTTLIPTDQEYYNKLKAEKIAKYARNSMELGILE